MFRDVRVRANRRHAALPAGRTRPNDRVVISTDQRLNRPVAVALEREVKLRFDNPDAARAAVLAAGATPLRGRRLQEDCLLDSVDEQVRRRRGVLRVRMEGGKSLLTFKGPVQPSIMKVREELETIIGA